MTSQMKIPPQQTAAEVAALAALILAGDYQAADSRGRLIRQTIFGELKVDDFYVPEHVMIYQALLGLRRADVPIDLITVRDQLRLAGQLEAVGGVSYLTEMLEQLPSVENSTYYATMVKEASRKRQMISVADEVCNRAFDETVAADEAFGYLKQQTDTLARQCKGNSICLATVSEKEVGWLWPDRFAVGKLSLLAGDPGLGKSFVTLDLAARVSTGRAWPDHSGVAPLGSVLLMSAEDDLDDTIVPRLRTMEADLSKIKAFAKVCTLGKGLVEIENELMAMGDCKLIVIDPISCYLGKGVDGNSNSDVRGVLAPLAELAARHGVGVLCISHLNKSGGQNVMYRTTGSLAFTAAARSVYCAVSDDQDNSRRLLLPVKNNIAPEAAGLSFRLIENTIAWDATPVHTTAREFFERQAGDTSGTGGRRTSARDEAKAWLKELLKDGPVWANEARAMAKDEGLNHNTLNTARQELAIVSVKDRARHRGKWYWCLPEHSDRTPPDQQDP